MTNAELQPALPTSGRAGDESTTLIDMLDYYRTVLARKASGLTAEQLDTALAPSDLTLGGLIYHMALVEDAWFYERFQGNATPEPWAGIDWEADFDWEFHNANQLTSEALLEQYWLSIARSRSVVEAADSLDQLAPEPGGDGEYFNLRWILVHMIEEYARHVGHADFIRQSIDGVVDD